MIYGRPPAVWAALIAALLNLVILFGVKLTADQVTQINIVVGLALAAIAGPGTTALVTRQARAAAAKASHG